MSNYFEFNGQVKVCCGENSLANLAYELDFLNCKNPLLLSDEGLVACGTLDVFKKAVKPVEFKTEFTKIPADSSTLTINQIARLYRNNKCDGIVAVGGGSVIDTAKGVKLVLSQNCEDIIKLSGNEIVKKGTSVAFVVVPTTCGTGSEVTSVAVIKDVKTKTKLEFISSELLPDCCFLDLKMTQNLPAKLLVSTAIDALTHSVEAYSSLQKNPISDVYALGAVKLIAGNLLDAVDGDSVAKSNLLLASNMAGLAFSNSMVGIVHAIGHALGAVLNVPHGVAMMMLIVPCLRFNKDVNHVEYSNLLLYLTNEDTFAYTKPNERATAFIDKLEELITKLQEKTGIKLKLTDYGATEKELDLICEKAMNDGASVTNNKIFTREDVMEILKEIY